MTIYRGVPLTDIPQGHYRAVLADPPWKFLTRSAKGLGKSPDRHYKTMTIDEIKALPVREVCAKDAVLFMWVIDTHAELAFDVIRAWGFKYKTVGLYWAKTTKDGKGFPMGTGFWTRANPEHALQGTLECAYCADTGWFYGDPELGPCGCGAGNRTWNGTCWQHAASRSGRTPGCPASWSRPGASTPASRTRRTSASSGW